jgi:hypothetical protein
MDLETRQVVERPVLAVHVFDYRGDLVEIRNSRMNLLVTPNHRLLVLRNHGLGPLGFETAESRLEGGHTTIPTPRPWSGLARAPAFVDTEDFLEGRELACNANPPVRMRIGDFLYLMGLHIGDGYLSTGKVTLPVKTGLSHEERAAVRNQKGQFVGVPGPPIGVKTYEAPRVFIASPQGDRSRGPLLELLHEYEIHATTTPSSVVFTNRALSAALASCGADSLEKTIPAWVLRLPADQLRHLFRGLMDSDGAANGSCYTTASARLAYQMVGLCAKLGLHSRLSWRPPRTTSFKGKLIRSRGSFDVGITRIRRTVGFTPDNMRLVPYEGKVWCPSVPPHENLLVEREGKFVFCGNTKFGDGGCDFLPLGDLYKTQVREMAVHLGVPRAIVEKAPSAGLWRGQTDEGELGIAYDELDRILLGIELQLLPAEIAERADVPVAQVRRIERLVAANVHKRKTPLIPKVGIRTFGLDWRE